MARLNEPPVAPAVTSSLTTATLATTATGGAETLEASMRTRSKPTTEPPPANFDEVKRRFIRQNRELAKNNSSQSLRIRNLELELSKLLGENLDLREQVLGLQNEVEQARMEATSDALTRMKDELRTKLLELSGIVDGMDSVKDSQEMMQVDKRHILSPSQRQYRERETLAELMQETVMPTISEHKLYPRKTLDAEEIRGIRLSDRSGASGSPDLGPPPVAHFDCEDPIKFSNSREGNQQEEQPIGADEEFLPSINLETRRKRRDTLSKVETRRHSILALSPVKPDDEAATVMLRTGAKRKLADRETEKSIKPPSQGDFTFSRRATADQSGSESEQANPSKPAQDPAIVGMVDTAAEAARPARRVLADKSTNMSPKKANPGVGKGLKDDVGKPAPARSKAAVGKDSKSVPRNRRISSIPAPSQDEVGLTIDIPPPELVATEQLRPKTPAAPDVFSPMTSEPSGSMRPSADTPPPGDLSSMSNTTEGGMRPSRRARSAVNYAEPSLIAKMRRPDKQMVDAVKGLQDPRRVMNPSKDRRSTEPPSESRTVYIKKEPVEEDIWQSALHPINPAEGSPLREKSTDDHPPPAPTDDGLLGGETAHALSEGPRSSVIAISRRRRQQLDLRESQGPVQDVAKKMEELDLYDFKDSSSPAREMDKGSASAEGARKTTITTSHRRHSSVPKNAELVPSSTAAARTERMSSRRRSMMV